MTRRLLLVLCIALALTACNGAAEEISPPTFDGMPPMPDGLTEARVSNVVDGDTLDVAIGGVEQRIRMLGMDTPETKHPSKPVECFGREASEQASALLQGTVVLLEADQSQGDADQYGWLLRFVWLPDGRLVNLVLIAEGYAFEYTYNRPYRYQTQFQAAQAPKRPRSRSWPYCIVKQCMVLYEIY